ncbi:MAG: hypothetical protein AAF799_17870 [Myxococcota bacterium]
MSFKQSGGQPSESVVSELVGFALAEQHDGDNVWRDWCAGTLERDEVIEMRQGKESPEGIALRLEAFAPASRKARSQTLDTLLSRFFADDESPLTLVPNEDDASGRGSTSKQSQSPQRGPDLRVIVGGVTALAAAALLVWVLDPQGSIDEQPLPEYRLEAVGGGSGAMRALDDGPQREGCDAVYRPGQDLKVHIVPSTASIETLSVAVWDEPAAGSSRWLPLEAPRQSVEGTVTLQQSIETLGLSTGAHTLTFFVTRQGERFDLEQLRALPPGSHAGVSVFRQTFCIEDQ